jgi:EAL domain-containing protein (putative c-di-GMP-specific phosphodiesterase class I)
MPDDAYLAINAGPQTVRHLAASGLLDEVDLSRIVIELTEHFEVDDYPALSGELFELRRRGARVAIDDTGTGFSTFAHILRLAPDIIKLDRILTVGIDIDPIRRALAGALTTFAGETGAIVVAEGIETEAELTTVRNLGIQFGQGYHLGRPGPVESVPTSWIPVPRSQSTRHK